LRGKAENCTSGIIGGIKQKALLFIIQNKKIEFQIMSQARKID